MSRSVTVRRPTRSALAGIRTATRSAHHRLHDHPLLVDLGRAERAPPAFRAILEAFYGFYAGLEPVLVDAAWRLERSALYARPIRTEWLARDLRCLGHCASSLDTLPRCHEQRTPRDLGELAGVVYVVEGSSLGGRRIVRTMPWAAALPTRFFDGHGSDTAARWRRVGRFVESACTSADTLGAALDSATWTFGALERWLDACAHPRAPA